MPRRGGAPSTGGSAGAAASPSPSSGGTTSSSLLTPEKRTSSASASFEQKWHTPQKPIYGDLTPALKCNRPSCNHDLRLFIPPGTKPNGGVTFAACSDLNCAGGGSLLAFDTHCDLCYRVIPAKSVCLSLPSSVAGKKSYLNQQLRNCLKDVVPNTTDSAVASKATAKDIGQPCTNCTRADGEHDIQEGDFILSTASLGTRYHFQCAVAKRKDFTRAVFSHQDERHARYVQKEQNESAEKRSKTEATVSLADLAFDSDGDL